MESNLQENCVFCKIIKGDLPSWTVYEDEDFKAFLDIEPASKGHIIVIPKRHASNLFELLEEDTKKVLIIVKRIATALRDILQCDGINIVQNNGECAGQTVFHFHIHVIPRYEGDSNQINIKWSQGISVDFNALQEQICKKLMSS